MIIPKDSGIDLSANVRAALQASSDALTVLCTHDNIRPWAKYKPVIINDPAPDRNSDWWKGYNRQCGFIYKVLNTFEEVKAEYANPQSWTYEKIPADMPKRLPDFRGYNSEATAPVLRAVPPTSPDNAPGGIITFTLQAKSTPNEGELGFADFDDIGDGYLGVAIYGPNGFYKAATSTKKMSQGGILVEFDSGGFLPREYTAIPFLAMRNPIYEGQNLPSNRYIALPNCSIMTFKVEDASTVMKPTLRISAILTKSQGVGTIDVTITLLKLGKTEETLFSPVAVNVFDNYGNRVTGQTLDSWQVDMRNEASKTINFTFRSISNQNILNFGGKVSVSLSQKYQYDDIFILMEQM